MALGATPLQNHLDAWFGPHAGGPCAARGQFGPGLVPFWGSSVWLFLEVVEVRNSGSPLTYHFADGFDNAEITVPSFRSLSCRMFNLFGFGPSGGDVFWTIHSEPYMFGPDSNDRRQPHILGLGLNVDQVQIRNGQHHGDAAFGVTQSGYP